MPQELTIRRGAVSRVRHRCCDQAPDLGVDLLGRLCPTSTVASGRVLRAPIVRKPDPRIVAAPGGGWTASGSDSFAAPGGGWTASGSDSFAAPGGGWTASGSDSFAAPTATGAAPARCRAAVPATGTDPRAPGARRRDSQ